LFFELNLGGLNGLVKLVYKTKTQPLMPPAYNHTCIKLLFSGHIIEG